MALSTEGLSRALGALCQKWGLGSNIYCLLYITISQFPNITRTTSQMTAGMSSKELNFGVSMFEFSPYVYGHDFIIAIKIHGAFIICQAVYNTLDLHHFV